MANFMMARAIVFTICDFSIYDCIWPFGYLAICGDGVLAVVGNDGRVEV